MRAVTIRKYVFTIQLYTHMQEASNIYAVTGCSFLGLLMSMWAPPTGEKWKDVRGYSHVTMPVDQVLYGSEGVKDKREFGWDLTLSDDA
jgi:hypothetical protein